MTLTEYADLDQGTEEWFDVRRGIVTASAIGQLITPTTLQVASNDNARSLTLQLAAERINGWTEPTFTNFDMNRGKLAEPIARDIYGDNYGAASEIGFMVRDDWGFRIGYSPDGLVGSDGLIEVKTRRAKKHLQTVLADAVPAENMGQLQCGLLVSGREWIDYVSYCPGMAFWRKRVTADEQWQAVIVEAVTELEKAITQMVATYTERTTGLPATERILDLELVI